MGKERQKGDISVTTEIATSPNVKSSKLLVFASSEILEMSHKLEIVSAPGGHGRLMRQAAGHLDAFSAADLIAVDKHEVGLLRSWLVCDSVLRADESRRINWGAALGLGLATGVSVSIWTGIALAVAYMWK
jgi:hypothetical protein